MSSPTYIGIDTQAVKEATKNNYKAANSSSFDEKLYKNASEVSYFMGPAVSAGVASAQGADSTSAMAVDAAINASASGTSGLSTTMGAGMASYSTGGGYNGLSTGLGGSAAFSEFTPNGPSTGGDLETQDFMGNMTASNTEFLTMQMFVQNESSKFTMLSSILKSQHDSQMTAARNSA